MYNLSNYYITYYININYNYLKLIIIIVIKTTMAI